MASVTQLGYLGLSVSDVDAWERFATETLGPQVNGRDADGAVFLRMDEYHHRFIVHLTGKDDVAYIGWEVGDEQALQAMAERLRGAGVAAQR
jgi:2,3-dihydroxyethylbenzene 1,2-dioxygenase